MIPALCLAVCGEAFVYIWITECTYNMFHKNESGLFILWIVIQDLLQLKLMFGPYLFFYISALNLHLQSKDTTK